MKEKEYSIEFIEKNKLHEKYYGFIYVTTSKRDGMKYIGKKVFNKNWRTYLGSGKRLLHVKRKYGHENLERRIIDLALTEEELSKKETSFIEEVRAYEPNNMYLNIAKGGNGGYQVISAGKTEDEKRRWRENISLSHRLNGVNRGPKNHFYYRRGEKNPNSRRVVMLSPINGCYIKEFISLTEANKDFGSPNYGIQAIMTSCVKKTVMAHGYYWLFKEEYESMVKNNKVKEWFDNRYINSRKQKIYVLDKNTLEIIDTFKDAHSIAKKFGWNIKDIMRCCEHRIKTVQGFSLIFAHEYKEITKEGLKKLYRTNREKKVICLTTGEVFLSIKDACSKYSTHNTLVSKCCRGILKHTGKHPVTNEPLKWAYYSER